MTEVNLTDCFDAKIWAKEFCKLNTASDERTMVSWFANAIMAGYDYAKREIKSNTEQLDNSKPLREGKTKGNTKVYTSSRKPLRPPAGTT